MKRHRHTAATLALLALPALFAGGCGRAGESSPASTVQAACAAARARDLAAYRDTYSREKLANLAQAARMGGISADEMMGQLMTTVSCADTLELGGTKITGSVATLDAWDAASEDRTRFRFVLEGGRWKFTD